MRYPRHARYERVEKLLAILQASGGGGGYTPPAGAEGDLLVYHGGAWQSVIAPAAAGTVLTSLGVGVVPAYGFVVRTPFGVARFIDPSNSTGFASNSNTGATNNNVPPGSGPILTTAHLQDLIFLKSLTADTTLLYMSDDPTGSALDVTNGVLNLNGHKLFVQGTPQVTHTGGTLNAGTIAINPGANQRQVVHTSDLANFAPFVGQYVRDSVTLGTAWVMSATTPAAPSCTRPVNETGDGASTLTSGNAYTIRRGSNLTLSAGPGPTDENTVGFIVFADFTLQDGRGPAGSTFLRCAFPNGDNVENAIRGNCYVNGATAAGTISMSAGGFVTINGGGAEKLLLDSDTYVTGRALIVGSADFQGLSINAGFGAGVQIQDMGNSSIGGLCIYENVDLSGSLFAVDSPLIWGTGNVGYGISVLTGTLIVPSIPVPTVTGLLGDFAFHAPNGGTPVTVARFFDDTTGAYSEAGGVATRTTTWAHLAAATGAGGFNFQAHSPAAQASVIGF